MPGWYYSETASRLLVALGSEADSEVTMVRAARLACNALRSLERDLSPEGELRWSLEHLNNLSSADKDEATLALRGSRELFEVFLLTEVRALRKAGMPANVVEAIKAKANAARSAITDDTLNADFLASRVEALAESVCAYSAETERAEKIRKIVKNSAYALAGASTISINASVDAVTTLGLAPWMTALSGGIGCALIAKPFGG
jgi:hypothetical protein